MVERPAPYMWERLHLKDSRKTIVHNFLELWIQNNRMTRSTLEELFDAVGPLVAPATLCLGEPVPTDKHHVTFTCKKKFPLRFMQNMPYHIAQNRCFHNSMSICTFLRLMETHPMLTHPNHARAKKKKMKNADLNWSDEP